PDGIPFPTREQDGRKWMQMSSRRVHEVGFSFCSHMTIQRAFTELVRRNILLEVDDGPSRWYSLNTDAVNFIDNIELMSEDMVEPVNNHGTPPHEEPNPIQESPDGSVTYTQECVIPRDTDVTKLTIQITITNH